MKQAAHLVGEVRYANTPVKGRRWRAPEKRNRYNVERFGGKEADEPLGGNQGWLCGRGTLMLDLKTRAGFGYVLMREKNF